MAELLGSGQQEKVQALSLDPVHLGLRQPEARLGLHLRATWLCGCLPVREKALCSCRWAIMGPIRVEDGTFDMGSDVPVREKRHK